MSNELQPVRIFIAYSSKDLVFKEEIRKRLRPLQRAGKVDIWDNYDIEAGKDWDADIREKLDKSELILLLISPDALDSDYFYEVEAPIALRRHEAGEAIAVGVLLRPCDLKYTPFGDLTRYELLPKKGVPVVDPQWHHADEAYLSIFQEVDILVNRLERIRAKEADQIIKIKEFEQLEFDRLENNRLGKIAIEQKHTPEEAHNKIDLPENIPFSDQQGIEVGILEESEDQLNPILSAEGNRKYSSGKIIGIDFGTLNSCVSVLIDSKPMVIQNNEGFNTTPSFIAFLPNGETKIGEPAKRQTITNPQQSISFIKSFLGASFSGRKNEMKSVPYKVVNNGKDEPLVEIDGNRYSPQQISARILKNLKETAENYLGELISEAVITVPDYFNYLQRLAVKSAGKLAGLEVKFVLNESAAVALAYCFDKKDHDMRIVVYDLGGYGFSTSILDVVDGVIEVISVGGMNGLGGKIFDQMIVDWLADAFINEHGVDLRKDPTAHQRLFEAAENAKIELSNSSESEINLPYIVAIDAVPKHIWTKISRNMFEQMIGGLVAQTIEICRENLEESSTDLSEIEDVVLVGGSTRIPLVAEQVERFFKKRTKRPQQPDEAASIGAAIRAGLISGNVPDIILLEGTNLSVGVETMDGAMDVVIASNTTMPCKKQKRYTTTIDYQNGVEIHILQGDKGMARDNVSLGRLLIEDIPPQKRGQTEIEVTFEIDNCAILKVTAVVLGTDKCAEMQFASFGLIEPYSTLKNGYEVATFNPT